MRSVTPESEPHVALYERHGIRLFAKVAQAAALGSRLLPQYEHVTEARWRYPMPEEVCRAHYADVARRLAFLGNEWVAAETPARDRSQLARAGAAVLEARPGEGPAVREVLESVSRREDEIHDLRRVLRWAITGQEVAPPLTTVWDLLGADRALERLSNALARIG